LAEFDVPFEIDKMRSIQLIATSYMQEIEVLNKSNIKRVFKEVGLHPFAPEAMMRRARYLVGGYGNDRSEDLTSIIEAMKVLYSKKATSIRPAIVEKPKAGSTLVIVADKSKTAYKKAPEVRLEKKVSKVALTLKLFGFENGY
jgi:hypothetical protein